MPTYKPVSRARTELELMATPTDRVWYILAIQMRDSVYMVYGEVLSVYVLPYHMHSEMYVLHAYHVLYLPVFTQLYLHRACIIHICTCTVYYTY